MAAIISHLPCQLQSYKHRLKRRTTGTWAQERSKIQQLKMRVTYILFKITTN